MVTPDYVYRKAELVVAGYTDAILLITERRLRKMRNDREDAMVATIVSKMERHWETWAAKKLNLATDDPKVWVEFISFLEVTTKGLLQHSQIYQGTHAIALNAKQLAQRPSFWQKHGMKRRVKRLGAKLTRLVSDSIRNKYPSKDYMLAFCAFCLVVLLFMAATFGSLIGEGTSARLVKFIYPSIVQFKRAGWNASLIDRIESIALRVARS